MAEKPMTATERKELRRIINARFEVLEQELSTKRKAIQTHISQEMTKSKQADIERHKEALKELAAKAEAFNAEAETVEAALKADGLVPTSTNYRGNGRQWQYASGVATVNVCRDLEVANISQHVQEATNALMREHGVAKLDLRKMQLAIEEDLAMGVLMSAEAQDFLTKIPTAEKLLPSPDTVEVPALEA